MEISFGKEIVIDSKMERGATENRFEIILSEDEVIHLHHACEFYTADGRKSNVALGTVETYGFCDSLKTKLNRGLKISKKLDAVK